MQSPHKPPIAEKDTAAYKVFKWRFEVLIPSAYALSQYEIEQMGTLTTGDRKLDAELANEVSHTYRTISEMAKLHSEGCEIRLVNPAKDAPRIYDVTHQLLVEWAETLNQGFDVQLQTPESKKRIDAALRDIELLEAFVEKIYPIAKRVMPAAYRANGLAARLAQLTNLKLRFSPVSKPQPPTLDKNAPSPFTDNLTEFGKDKIRRWAYKDVE